MNQLKRLLTTCLLILGLITADALVTSTPAQAAGCRIFNTADGGQPNGYGQMAGDWWTWSPTFTVPSWSTCHDVQVRYFSPTYCPDRYVYTEMQWYVGGQWVFQGHFTKVICGSTYWKITAYDLNNGTPYRFLLLGYNPFDTDVMD